MEQVRADIDGHGFVFHLTSRTCPIQGRHRVGKFYERDDLDRLARYVPRGAHVVDVGANVGNHALFFATFMQAARVICFEPNPEAAEALRANVAANGLGAVIDLSALGVGLSDRAARGFKVKRHATNPGAARLKQGGDIAVYRGDDLLEDEPVDLIKIDVEGMEMQVLSGLDGTVERCRPVLFVEVDRAHEPAFDDWRAAHRYTEAFRTQRFAQNTNICLQPAEKQR